MKPKFIASVILSATCTLIISIGVSAAASSSATSSTDSAAAALGLQTDKNSTSRIFTHQELMRLSAPQRAVYIQTLRTIIVEVEHLKKRSRSSHLSAQLRLLETLFAETEAAAAAASAPSQATFNLPARTSILDAQVFGTVYTCPEELTNRPNFARNLQAGAVLSCPSRRSKTQKCPAGYAQYAQLDDFKANDKSVSLVCYIPSKIANQDRAVVKAGIAKGDPLTINQMQKQKIAAKRAARAKDAAAKVALDKRAKAFKLDLTANGDKPAVTTSDTPAAPASASAAADGATPAAPAAPAAPDVGAAEPAAPVTDSTTSDAAAAAAKSFGDAAELAAKTNPPTDEHPVRPGVDVKILPIDDAARGTKPVVSTKQNCPVPSDELDPKTCSDSTIEDARRKIASSNEPHCLVGGNFSHYQNAVDKKTCMLPNSFCVGSISCTKPDGSKAVETPTLSCKNANDVICNPYVFNIDKQNQPLCVPRDSDIATACLKKSVEEADPTHPFISSASSMDATRGIVEGWNEFTEEINKMCFKAPNSDFYCRECQIIKSRVAKLNLSVMNAPAEHPEVACGMLHKLRIDESKLQNSSSGPAAASK